MASVPSRSGSKVGSVIASVSCAWPCGVSEMLDTLPIGLPADDDLVAGDDLTRVQEDRADLVAAATAEDDRDHGHQHDNDRRDRGDPSDHR